MSRCNRKTFAVSCHGIPQAKLDELVETVETKHPPAVYQADDDRHPTSTLEKKADSDSPRHHSKSPQRLSVVKALCIKNKCRIPRWRVVHRDAILCALLSRIVRHSDRQETSDSTAQR